MAEQMFKETLQRYMNKKKTDRLLHNILVFAAGPGTGKSRMNMDAVKLMISAGNRMLDNMNDETEKQHANELLELMTDGVSISVTYGNGTSVVNADEKYGFYSLGRRILFEYFVGKRMTLKDFDTLLDGNLPTLDEALSIIREYKVRYLEYKKEEVFIYVGIDEYSKYSTLANDAFRKMFNDVGSVMCNSPKGVFFQPLFTGVDYRNLEIITKSMHTHVYLSSTLLRFESMAEIADYMVQKHVWLKSWRVSRHFKRMMADVGGHPRSFEYFLEECLIECNHYKSDIVQILSTSDSANRLWNRVVDKIKNKYLFSDLDYNVMERCMIDSFLQKEVTMDEGLKTLYLSGLITLKMTTSIGLFTIEMPLIWFYVFTNEMRFSPIMKAIQPFLSPKVEYFEQFEKFVIDFNLLMNNLRVHQNVKEITLEEQVRGALFQNEKLKKQKVKLVNMDYCYSEKQYAGGKDNMIKNRETNESIDCKDGKYFVLNAPHASFADIFASFYLTNGERMAHLGQSKHRNPKAISKNPKLTFSQIEREHKKATGNLDRELFKNYVFVMYTMDDLSKDVLDKINHLPQNTAIIYSNNFSHYFGNILSSRAELEYIGNRECYPNIDSKTELMAFLNNKDLCDKIVQEREGEAFKDLEDFKERITSGLNKNNEIYSLLQKAKLFYF